MLTMAKSMILCHHQTKSAFLVTWSAVEDDSVTPFPLPSGRKTMAKNMKNMRQYDQTLPNAHELLFKKFCFGGVHRFR